MMGGWLESRVWKKVARPSVGFASAVGTASASLSSDVMQCLGSHLDALCWVCDKVLSS